MKQLTQVEETLFSATHPQLDKQVSIKQILVSSCVALCGVVGIILSFVLEHSNSTLCMIFLSIGILLMLFAIYRFYTKSEETIYKATGSKVRPGTLYMDTGELQNFQQMVKKNDFSDFSRMTFKEGGNGRLDYLVSKDGQFVAFQLFQFVPYTYESVSDKLYYTDDDAVAVVRCMNI